MTHQKHTPGALRAAEALWRDGEVHFVDVLKNNPEWKQFLKHIAAIIDRETRAPQLLEENEQLKAQKAQLLEVLEEIRDRQDIQMLCPTAPSAGAARGFKLGAEKATMECVEIAEAAAKEKP